MNAAPRSYEIQQVAELTGLSPARLRAWELRYEVVRPRRQANGYRAYSADQVALLRALAQLVGQGDRIGDLVEHPTAQLVARAAEQHSDHPVIGRLVEAVRALDRTRIERGVAEQVAKLGLAGFASEVVLPLAEAVGDEWALGTLPIAAEHLASEVVVHALKGGMRKGTPGAPVIVAACLPGDRHEWGILAMLTQAHARGWQVQYLGADLPVDQGVEASWRLIPRHLVLGASDAELCEAALPALATLIEALPAGTSAIIGGRGAEPHRKVLTRYGLQVGERAFTRAVRAGAPR